MSKLNRITFTGLDDYTKIDELVKIEQDFPSLNIEWGILFSGAVKLRYPSVFTVDEATSLLKNCAAHLCGKEFDKWWTSYYHELITPLIAKYKPFKRIQLNFNAQKKPLAVDKLMSMMFLYSQEFIIQHNKANTWLCEQLQAALPNSDKWAILFDSSGGRGKMTRSWPVAFNDVRCAWAGGLGPDNLRDSLRHIDTASLGMDFGIDMEGNIRNDANYFNVNKVRQCCEIAEEFNQSGV